MGGGSEGFLIGRPDAASVMKSTSQIQHRGAETSGKHETTRFWIGIPVRSPIVDLVYERALSFFLSGPTPEKARNTFFVILDQGAPDRMR